MESSHEDERRRREVDEELDESTAPVDEADMGLTDATELSPERDEALMNPLDDVETDADTGSER